MEKKNEYMREKKGKQGRDRNFMIRFVIFQGGKICVCQLRLERQAERPAGRLLPFIGRQINRGGAAWRQKGHYQRLGQTEIRASFGPGRQANARTQSSERVHAHTHRDPGKTSPWKDWKTVKPCALRKCHL